MLNALGVLGLHEKPLNYRDFLRMCADFGILLFHTNEPTIKGVAFTHKNRRIIVLNRRMRGRFKTYVAFHELGHHLYDHHGVRLYSSEKCTDCDCLEAEADTLAFCAIISRNLIISHTDAELLKKGFCRWGIKERRRIYNDFGW